MKAKRRKEATTFGLLLHRTKVLRHTRFLLTARP